MANKKKAPAWTAKSPADMSDEELREAVQAVHDDLGPTQDRLNVLSALNAHLQAEVSVRFRTGTPPVATTLPGYSVEDVSALYGDGSAADNDDS